MRKVVAPCPDWPGCSEVRDVFSVSKCISPNFARYHHAWLHNGFWLFDSPEAIAAAAALLSADLTATTLFYYEMDGLQLDPAIRDWSAVKPVAGVATDVILPATKLLHGYDVVSFPFGTGAQCSPLSCNAIATQAKVNAHCLYDCLDDARAALVAGVFDGSEEGPFRILAVHTIE